MYDLTYSVSGYSRYEVEVRVTAGTTSTRIYKV
jgi:hypothetical protein